MSGITIRVQVTGPVFTGRALALVDEYLTTVVEEIAKDGVPLVQDAGRADYKHRTGHYESGIVTDRVSKEAVRIWDSAEIYGPWLEGISSRNQTTRFKGYSTFRKTTQQVDRRVPAVAGRLLDEFVARINA